MATPQAFAKEHIPETGDPRQDVRDVARLEGARRIGVAHGSGLIVRRPI
jgi:hypothetical protein